MPLFDKPIIMEKDVSESDSEDLDAELDVIKDYIPKKRKAFLTLEEIKAALQADIANGQLFQIPTQTDWSPASVRDRLYKLYNLPACIVKDGIANNPNIAPDHKALLIRFMKNRKDFELYYAVAQGLK